VQLLTFFLSVGLLSVFHHVTKEFSSFKKLIAARQLFGRLKSGGLQFEASMVE
jgi:hypothetical protein